MSDDNFKAFELDVFQKHIYQEKRKQAENVAWQFRRNYVAKKEFDEEVERMAECWDIL